MYHSLRPWFCSVHICSSVSITYINMLKTKGPGHSYKAFKGFLRVETCGLRGASPPRPPLGLRPWTPPGALKRAPGPPAATREAPFASLITLA